MVARFFVLGDKVRMGTGVGILGWAFYEDKIVEVTCEKYENAEKFKEFPFSVRTE